MWRAWIRLLCYSSSFSLLILIAAIIEPFGIDDAVERQSRDALYTAFSSAYDGFRSNAAQFMADPAAAVNAPPRPSSLTATRPARERITTIYVSENVISDMRRISNGDGWQNWRPGYKDHAFLIDDIVYLHQNHVDPDGEVDPWLRPPPAIFFDFIFIEQGVGDTQEQFQVFLKKIREVTRADAWADKDCGDNLRKLACIKNAGGIPLIFAEGLDVSGADAPPEIEKAAILAPVFYTGVGDGYPTHFPTGESDEATPASLLYVAWCLDNAGGCPDLEPAPGADPRERADNIVAAFRTRMSQPVSVVWGAGVPDDFVAIETRLMGTQPGLRQTSLFGDRVLVEGQASGASAGDKLICRVDKGWPSVAIVFARQVFGGLGFGKVDQPCPYHVELPYSAIPGGYVDDTLAKNLFDGRIIMVGGRFRNGQDWTLSAVHGKLPGLHKHAMALDNILTFGRGYLRAPQPVFNGGFIALDAQDLFEAATLFVVALAGGLGQLWINRRLIRQVRAQDMRDRRPSHWIVYLTMFLTAVFIVLASLLIAVFVLQIQPPNWIGIFSIAVGFYIYLLRDEFFDDIGRVIRRSKHLGAAALESTFWTMNYLDLETLGFESDAKPSELKAAKKKVVDLLYPPRRKAAIPVAGPRVRHNDANDPPKT